MRIFQIVLGLIKLIAISLPILIVISALSIFATVEHMVDVEIVEVKTEAERVFVSLEGELDTVIKDVQIIESEIVTPLQDMIKEIETLESQMSVDAKKIGDTLHEISQIGNSLRDDLSIISNSTRSLKDIANKIPTELKIDKIKICKIFGKKIYLPSIKIPIPGMKELKNAILNNPLVNGIDRVGNDVDSVIDDLLISEKTALEDIEKVKTEITTIKSKLNDIEKHVSKDLVKAINDLNTARSELIGFIKSIEERFKFDISETFKTIQPMIKLLSISSLLLFIYVYLNWTVTTLYEAILLIRGKRDIKAVYFT